MIGEITNHLWQSTVFAFAVALVALAFRKNRAEVRYWLWLSASLKFLVPFALLIGVGIRMWDALPAGKTAPPSASPSVSQTMVEITQPFSESFGYVSAAHHTTNWIPIAIIVLWAFGFFCVAFMRCRSWFRIRAAIRASVPINIAATIPVRSSATLLEPGVVGFLRPVLLLPEGILKKLTPPQLEAVLAHEQCHISRRDNLTSALHMLVEAIFWFHPVVWWIGAKLVEERERACDETVLTLGNEPQAYAEGILNVCKSYLESPLRCVSGVTGSDLKKRIRTILSERVAGDLNFARKFALALVALAALAVPICVGLISAPTIRAQSQGLTTIGPEFKYDIVSIRQNKVRSHAGMFMGMRPTPDGFAATNVTLQDLISWAYGTRNNEISRVASWVDEDRYDVDAKMDDSLMDEIQKLSKDQSDLVRQHMLQALLEDRFKLAIHRETKALPAYSLVIGKNGIKMKESKPGDTYPSGFVSPAGRGRAGDMLMGSSARGYTFTAQALPFPKLVIWLSVQLGRPVTDNTGLTGAYDFTMNYAPERDHSRAQSGSESGLPTTEPGFPSLEVALEDQLGLKLVSGKGSVEVIVIDHIERPSGN